MKQLRTPIPTELRRQVLVESGHRCAIPSCRRTEIDVHHIIPWGICKKHEFDNLIALCPNCHRMVHLGKIDRKSLKIYKENLKLLPLNILNDSDTDDRALKKTQKNIAKNILKEILDSSSPSIETLKNHILQNPTIIASFPYCYSENLYKSCLLDKIEISNNLAPDLVKVDLFREHFAQVGDSITFIYFGGIFEKVLELNGELTKYFQNLIKKSKNVLDSWKRYEKGFLKMVQDDDKFRLEPLDSKIFAYYSLIVIGKREHLSKKELITLKEMNSNILLTSNYIWTYNHLLESSP